MPSPCPRMLHVQYGGASDERQSPPSRWQRPACLRPCWTASTRMSAGIDCGIGGTLCRGAAGSRVRRPVQSFSTFTTDLVRLADWLVACGVTSVAMEATGVYWIPIYDILEARGVEVAARERAPHQERAGPQERRVRLRVAPRPPQRRPAPGKFSPDRRHRRVARLSAPSADPVESAGTYVQRMQKALVQMNVQLPLVVSDITGVTGTQNPARHCRRAATTRSISPAIAIIGVARRGPRSSPP